MIPILIAIVVLPLLWAIIVYNGLISKRNQVRNTTSTIDVQLKKRWDLIPNLVEAAKGFAKHEKELFESVIAARSAAMNDSKLGPDRLAHEAQISQMMPKLLAISESYPELKSSEHFLNLQRNLTEVEAQIAAARRAFNASIFEYNNGVEMFPSSLIAGMFNFRRMEDFEILEVEREVQNVSF